MSHSDTDFSRASAWKSEIARSQRLSETYWEAWQENLNSYIGKNPEAEDANRNDVNFVNVNADFKNVEVKMPQLFFDTPELQLSAKGQFSAPAPPAMPAPPPGAPPGMAAPPQAPPPDPASIIATHRELLDELLGPDGADVITTVQKAMKAAVAIAGFGPTKIYYEATMEDIETPPEILAVMPDQGPTISRPIDEKWAWDTIPLKKFRVPADFKDSDFDAAPYLAMNFRLPLTVAKRTLKLPADFDERAGVDTRVLTNTGEGRQNNAYESSVPYVDGVEIWYYAHIYDEDPKAINPKLIRRHVLVEGVDEFVEKATGEGADPHDNPYQTLLPNGRLSADSMIGYPIHVLTIRNVPDSAYIPSDETMTRPLVRELNKFRSQQVMERDANIPRIGYDSARVPPETIKRIEQGTIGSMIPFPPDVLAAGMPSVMAQITQGNQTRGAYTANDYIQHDLDMTLGIDATGSGVQSNRAQTATEVTTVEKLRNVRLNGEQRQVLRWYIKGVQKFSALVCRFATPELLTSILGQQKAQVWAGWDKQTWDGRFVFRAKPDSQLSIDGAARRKYLLDLYQYLARDPNVNRQSLLKQLLESANLDPTEIIVQAPPEKKPDPSLGFTFKGEDFVAPQAPIVLEILAQAGVQISPQAQQQAASQMFQQVALGIRTPDGKAVTAPPAGREAQHGGVVEKVRPLDQQSADQSGQRSGPKVGGQPS